MMCIIEFNKSSQALHFEANNLLRKFSIKKHGDYDTQVFMLRHLEKFFIKLRHYLEKFFIKSHFKNH